MEIEDVLSLSKAAKIAGRHPATLRHAILNGELKATKPSARVTLILRKDLEAWMNAEGRWQKGGRGRPPLSERNEPSEQ